MAAVVQSYWARIAATCYLKSANMFWFCEWRDLERIHELTFLYYCTLNVVKQWHGVSQYNKGSIHKQFEMVFMIKK